MPPVHPPGTILQHLYLKERLAARPPGTFVEVGTGSGHLARLLLDAGWRGTGWDLSGEALVRARLALAPAIEAGRLTLREGNWLDAPGTGDVDLVVSCMVIEHLSDDDERRYFARCREALAPGGVAALFVPASMRHWGVEDDLAGHLRRYTAETLTTRVASHGWRVTHLAGLTWPVSNVLLPISNALVARAERAKAELDLQARTESSGRRDVPMKTSFPPLLGALLNETTMYPFHLWQKAARNHPDALVLYAECAPVDGA